MSSRTPKEMRALRTYQRALEWRESNPRAWGCIVRQANHLAAMKQPISVQGLIESVRKKAFV